MVERRRLLWVVVAGTMLLGTAATAFAPTPRWLIRRALWLQLERNIESLTATFDLMRYDIDGYPRGFRTTQRLTVVAPDKLRRETDLPDGALVEVQNGAKALLEVPKKGVQLQKARPTVWEQWITAGKPLDAPAAGDRVVKGFEQLGIDVEQVSFSRFDGRVCYVIGAKPWEKDKPQAWLDKETLHLTRLIWVGTDKQRQEQRFIGWGSAEGGAWLPKSIERYRGDTLIERATLRDVERNQAVDRARFVIEK